MKKKNIEKIMEDFYEEYQNDPEGWNFWVSPPPSSDDFHEAYIIHGDEAFFLKLDSIYSPNPVGVGTKLKIEKDQLVENLPEFGYRKFSKEEAEKFLKNLPRPQKYDSEEKFLKDLKKSRKDIVKKAMKRNPVPFEPLEEPGELAAIGPYSGDSPFDYLSDKQKKLRNKLSKELEKLVQRNYPGYY